MVEKTEPGIRCITLPAGLFYNGDCIEGASRYIPDNSVDLIITDPPYGINGDTLHKHYNRDETFVVNGYVEIPQEKYGKFSLKWIKEAERVLRPGGTIYIISGYTNLYYILDALHQTGLKEVNHIVWKYSFGVFTRRKFVSSHYHILFYEKPGAPRTFNLESRYGLSEKDEEGRSFNNIDREDVWIINRDYKPGVVKNKNELPPDLLTKMIQYSSNEGDLVCDFFLGGFSTARVAIGLRRRATGFEISQAIFDIRIKEIEEMEPGSLIPLLRQPAILPRKNQWKSWTDRDIRYLAREFRERRARGETKKVIIAALGKALGRGQWAIVKALKKFDNTREQ
jgi:site-specific DNA-methyltransferase (adenine-specific)